MINILGWLGKQWYDHLGDNLAESLSFLTSEALRNSFQPNLSISAYHDGIGWYRCSTISPGVSSSQFDVSVLRRHLRMLTQVYLAIRLLCMLTYPVKSYGHGRVAMESGS